MLIKNILLVGVGGGIGSIARFFCQKYIPSVLTTAFPLSTLIVNILGCLLIGIFHSLSERTNILSPEMRIFITTGLCGGFTTFSAFALENVQLLRSENIIYMFFYTAASVVTGLFATWFGMLLLK